MLSDFLTLEVYFGSENAALYFEELAEKNEKTRIEKAIEKGDLKCRTITFGPDRGRILTWLTEQGRQNATP